MAAVAVAVGACFRERSTSDVYASRPCPRRAASATHQPARLGGDLAGLRAAPEPWPQRRRRHPERVQLLDQALDPRRVGLGVDAVDRRHPLALEQLRHLFVGEDHQPLDQAVGLGLRRPSGRATTLPLGVEAELGLGGLDVEAGRAALLAQRRRGLAGDRQRLGDRLRRPPRGRRRSRSSWS